MMPAWPAHPSRLQPARRISTIGAMAETLKDRYFKYAHRCLDAAAKAATAEERVQFLEMAQSWRSLAEKCEVVDGLVEQAKEMRIIPPKSEMN
jgi:hypothetical protein